MISKISISEEFLRSQDQGLLAPLFSGVNAEYAAVLMFKSLDQMRINSTAKEALANAVADARQYFPGFKFERAPYFWLISKSKVKDSADTVCVPGTICLTSTISVVKGISVNWI